MPPRPANPAPAAPAERREQRRSTELERLRVLYNISNILTTTQRHDAVLRAILKEAVKVTRATSGSLILIERATGVLNIEIADNIDPDAASGVKLKIGEGVTGWVAKTGEPLLVGDVRSSPQYISLKSDVLSELAVPLIIGGEVVGIINLDSNKLNAFTEDDKDLMVAVAAQSGRVMQAARLNAENRRKANRLQTLFRISGAIVSEPLLEDVLRKVADEVRRLMDGRVCSIVLVDDRGEIFNIAAVAGDVLPAYAERKNFPISGTIIADVLARREKLYIADVREEPRYRLRAVAQEMGLCSLLAVPMIFLDKSIGVLNVYTDEVKTFPEEDVALLEAFAGHCAVAIVNAKRLQRIFRNDEMLREAEKFSLLGALSAEIAHEVLNPVTILKMLVHTVSSDKGLTKASRSDLKVMEKTLTHIHDIVDGVLDFSRQPRAENKEQAALNQIVEDVMMLVGHKANVMRRKINKRLSEGLPLVRVNPGQIAQAVLNIALNGLEAMKHQGETLHITTGQTTVEGRAWVYVRVRDEGPGLPEELHQKIFTPYFSMRDGGTGLGLFVTGKIVQEHGGRLKVKSAIGAGTTFDILLPAE